MACNANLQPIDIAGVVAAPIVHTNADTLDDYKIEDDDGIIAVGDIPQQPPHTPLVFNDTDDNITAGSDDDDNDNDDDGNDNNDDDDDEDNSSDEGDVDEPAATSKAEENALGSNQGVRRSRRRGKGVTQKYADYSLLMVARREKRGGHVGLSSAMDAFSFQQTI